MIIFLTLWLAMIALAAICGLQLDFPSALVAWSVIAATICASGAFLIAAQPTGLATLGGRFGSGAIRWGFRASQGRLAPAAMISWFIWQVLGTSLIGAIHFPADLPIILAWAGDSLGLCYVIGVMLTNRSSGRVTPPLVKFALSLIGLIAISAFLWFRAGTDGARAIAIAVAGGPPLFVAVGYGFVLTMGFLTSRRHN